MAHKYLEDLGINLEDTPYGYSQSEDLELESAQQRETYGFDDRETWSLNTTFVYWIYERVMMYKEVAEDNIDLEYHIFEIEGETLTQLECIESILEKCEIIMTEPDGFNDADRYTLTQEILVIWKEIISAMWW